MPFSDTAGAPAPAPSPAKAPQAPAPHAPLTMARVMRARTMYVEGHPIARILAETDMALGTLYACLDGMPFGREGPQLPPIPRRRQVLQRRRAPLPAENPVSLAARLIRTAERQARDIEARLSRPDQPPAERERDLRLVVLLVRCLRDLAALGRASAGTLSPSAPDAPSAEETEALRREIIRRVDNLRRQRDLEAGLGPFDPDDAAEAGDA
jgi:hypothetical protein